MSSKDSKRRSPAATRARAERFLAGMIQSGAAARLEPGGNELKLAGQRVRLQIAEADELVARDLAAWNTGRSELGATEAGRAWARRLGGGEQAYRAQHGDLSTDKSGTVTDMAESPLLWLHRRKDASGNPLIGDAMFAAGERLRADFTFGNMTPRVTLNWSSAPQGSCNPNGPEPSESALAARQRVRAALDRVGPELSGILIDVCCFLKRLEEVERDRQWPARSAKVILALALGRLARHYGYSDVAEGPVRRKA